MQTATLALGGTPLYGLYRYVPSSLDMGMFKEEVIFYHYRKENQQKPFTNYVYGTLTLV